MSKTEWRSLLNITLLGIPDIFNHAHIWGFRWIAEVSKFRRVLLESLCSNSARVGCRIVLLKFPKFVEMHNGYEWVQVIRQDAYVPFRVESRRIRGPISRQLHTPYTIMEPPPA
ncbi:uncharacterized protein TNCV_254451 [Trichonephila clavipes]|nr:uncharacterized protein TNCV_254451 [Trichonephila clavipes]